MTQVLVPTDPIMESDNPAAMLAQTDTMSDWSDEKKKEFAGLFKKRSTVARIICAITVSKFAKMCRSRHFISDYHLAKLKRSHGWSPDLEYKYDYGNQVRDAGRDWDEIMRLADDRAKALIRELPPLKKAVQVIDPETAKMLAKIERLEKKAETEKQALEELPTSINMEDDEYQDLTIRQFRVQVKELFDERKKLFKSMNKAGEEAQKLEIQVSKKLYKGLPGLSDAVVEVLKAQLERTTALDQMQRRVTEQVLYGDSEAATGLLKQFETDETAVSDELKGKLNAALATLKASVKALPSKRKKTTKALSGGKKKAAKKGSKK